MKSTISSKGQITVPVEVRRRLGFAPGTSVEFEVRGREVVPNKGSAERRPVDEAYGLLKLNRPVDELLDEMRGPRPERR